MAYFIKINEVVFKIPHRIVIGRGEPFTVLNDDRSVARSHLLMLKKNNSFYIKDLGTESGSVVDGVQIKPKKLTKVDPEKPIMIGGAHVVILSQQPAGDYIEIKGKSLKINPSNISYKLIFYCIGFVMIAMNMFKDWTNGKPIWEVLGIGVCSLLFIAIPITFVSKIFKIIQESAPNYVVNDVFFSHEGFTVHYDQGGSMTFKTGKIESWRLNNLALEINIYDEKHMITPSKDQLRLFEDHLLKFAKNKKSAKSENQWMGYLIFFSFCSIFSYFEFNIGFHLAALCIVLVLILCGGMFFSQDLRKYWPIPVSRKYPVEQQQKSIVLAGVLALYTGFLMVEQKQTFEAYSSCASKNIESCKEIDFLDDEFKKIEGHKQMIAFACENGNKSACRWVEGRSIASEKK